MVGVKIAGRVSLQNSYRETDSSDSFARWVQANYFPSTTVHSLTGDGAQKITDSLLEQIMRDIGSTSVGDMTAVLDSVSYELVLICAAMQVDNLRELTPQTSKYLAEQDSVKPVNVADPQQYLKIGSDVVVPIIVAKYHWDGLNIDPSQLPYRVETSPDASGNTVSRNIPMTPQPPYEVYMVAATLVGQVPVFNFQMRRRPNQSLADIGKKLGVFRFGDREYSLHVAMPNYQEPFFRAPSPKIEDLTSVPIYVRNAVSLKTRHISL